MANSFGQTADPHNQLKLLEDEIESEFGKRANLVRTDGGKDPSYSEVLKKREGSQSNEGQSQTPQEPVGPFEEHTKGIGRKILESKGWEDGKGLGNGRKEGIREAIQATGQTGKSRRGIGYKEGTDGEQRPKEQRPKKVRWVKPASTCKPAKKDEEWTDA